VMFVNLIGGQLTICKHHIVCSLRALFRLALFPKSDEHLWNNNGFDIAPYEYLRGHKDSRFLTREEGPGE
jgi:hypothetical protein